jgi:NAD(P)-dependent dehydrogenase (short-subunit alcohol dehydrogenase family)
MDVRDPKAIAAAADEVQRKFGALPNIIVNNAAGNFINVIFFFSKCSLKIYIISRRPNVCHQTQSKLSLILC